MRDDGKYGLVPGSDNAGKPPISDGILSRPQSTCLKWRKNGAVLKFLGNGDGACLSNLNYTETVTITSIQVEDSGAVVSFRVSADIRDQDKRKLGQDSLLLHPQDGKIACKPAGQ